MESWLKTGRLTTSGKSVSDSSLDSELPAVCTKNISENVPGSSVRKLCISFFFYNYLGNLLWYKLLIRLAHYSSRPGSLNLVRSSLANFFALLVRQLLFRTRDKQIVRSLWYLICALLRELVRLVQFAVPKRSRSSFTAFGSSSETQKGRLFARFDNAHTRMFWLLKLFYSYFTNNVLVVF